MRKLFLVSLIFLHVSGMIVSQEIKPDPTKQKSSIKVTYPSTGHEVIITTMCLVLWEREGILNTKVRIILFKSTGEKVEVISKSANNTGKYGWEVPYYLPEGSYRIRVKAGPIVNDGGIFGIKTPTFTVYEPHLDETLTVGDVKKISWHSQNATGTFAYIVLSTRNKNGNPVGSHSLAKKIPADKNEYGWVVGKYKNGTENLWPTDKDLSEYVFTIGVGLEAPPKYNYMSFGSEFYIKRKDSRIYR
jgi:hypothetical protein